MESLRTSSGPSLGEWVTMAGFISSQLPTSLVHRRLQCHDRRQNSFSFAYAKHWVQDTPYAKLVDQVLYAVKSQCESCREAMCPLNSFDSSTT